MARRCSEYLKTTKSRRQNTKTYNTEDSQVVTDPSTNSALCCLYMGERTGSLVFSRMWPYVKDAGFNQRYVVIYPAAHSL